tara:strand:- start:9790 stop:10008 length:219 start_codon:yes stop_codon:yes gene_type:complete
MVMKIRKKVVVIMKIEHDDDYAKRRYKVFQRHSEQLGSYAMSWHEFKISYNKKIKENSANTSQRTKLINILD